MNNDFGRSKEASPVESTSSSSSASASKRSTKDSTPAAQGADCDANNPVRRIGLKKVVNLATPVACPINVWDRNLQL
jgi:hypothetical protein